MLEKINRKALLVISCWLLVIGLLVYSRFINLGWGFPYPMHPDERNMANAIQFLNCKISNLKECFNPHFFAYGQFPLYLGYLLVWAFKGFKDFGKIIINFDEAVMSLRVISAVASIINVFVLTKIIELILNTKNQISKVQIKYQKLLSVLILIFTPFAIQFSHFGTTESLLMLFYSIIIYLSMRLLERRTTYEVVWLALVSGLAIATKVSSVIFLIIPVTVLISKINNNSKLKVLSTTLGFALCTLIFTLVFSPHNFINFQDFVSAIRYESDVALGKSLVFYTRQFFNTEPFYFQLIKIFPYALGWPTFILGCLGIIGLSWKDKKINLLRFAFLIYFIPSAMIYTKWSRFMAPVLPLILIFAILFILKIKDQISKSSSKLKTLNFILGFALCALIFAMIIPGLAYLSIYTKPDVRFQASEWIYKNIQENSYILSETANVVDIPFSNGTMKQSNNYNVISFNFYDLDENHSLQIELKNHLAAADYIFVPSRRIFANHPKQEYPMLNQYYINLFNGKLGFKKVAEFNSYPKICLPFTDKCLTFPDEQAEETWTVFDHPVIRIYKKVKQ